MKTLKDFQFPVWYFNFEGKIETMSYDEFLVEFWNDETTSPRGVENREQIASVIVEDDEIIEYSLNDRSNLTPDEGQELKWAVYSWGTGGRGPAKKVSELFDTEEESQVRILEGFEYDLQNTSSDRPMPYFSQEEIREVNEEMTLERINEKIRNKY